MIRAPESVGKLFSGTLRRSPHTIVYGDLEVLKSETLNDEKPRPSLNYWLSIVNLVFDVFSLLMIRIVHVALHGIVLPWLTSCHRLNNKSLTFGEDI